MEEIKIHRGKRSYEELTTAGWRETPWLAEADFVNVSGWYLAQGKKARLVHDEEGIAK